MQLAGNVAIVTGAGRGIGAAIARGLWSEGAAVVLTDVQTAAVQELADALGADRALAVPADVSNEEDVQNLVAATMERFGRLDILVNNAGISPRRNLKKVPIVEIDRTDWDRVMAVNLTGPFLCAKHAVPCMIEGGYGRVINIASMDARNGSLSAGAHYAASKGGLVTFTKTLATETARYGVTVNAIAPGLVLTDMTSARVEADPEYFRAQIPLGRVAQPEDIAGVVLFLASEASGYMTGATLDVNGGWLMP